MVASAPNVIISLKSAGIGNCMFQYAAARVCSLEMKGNLLIGLTDIQEHQMPFKKAYSDSERLRFLEGSLGVFSMNLPIANACDVFRMRGWGEPTLCNKMLRKIKKICWALPSSCHVEQDCYAFDASLLSMRHDVYMDGFFINPRYFENFEDILRKDFKFSVEFSEKNASFAAEISSSNAVAIHVRIGDYLHNEKIQRIYPAYGQGYYKQAIAHIESKVNDPVYYIFSDHPEWAVANLSFIKNAKIISHNPIEKGYEDLRLMSLCKHNIITNSTFSWWGAWLNPNPDKIVISPKKWINGYDASALLLAGWYVIDEP